MTRTKPDRDGFVELFWQHGAAVHAYLSRRAGRQDADDLLGEVWLQAFRSRERYDHRAALALRDSPQRAARALARRSAHPQFGRTGREPRPVAIGRRAP